MASEPNPFLSQESKTDIFASKNSFSSLYSGKEWDFESLVNSENTTPPLPLSEPPTTSPEVLNASTTGQEYIPELLKSSDWDAQLSMEDVKATAQALAQNHHTLIQPIATPKPDKFSDAFKSQDWTIMPESISQDVEFCPEILEKSALAIDAPKPKAKVVPKIFNSCDWVASEFLGAHKEVSLSPDIFSLEAESPEAPKQQQQPQEDKTNWESMFMDQLAPAAPPSQPIPAEEKMEDVEKLSTPKPTTTKKRKRKKRKKVVPEHKEYVSFCEMDVLLGRGGKSNHHLGNKRYREEVENFRPLYATLTNDKEKTEMSQILVDVIEKAGGRFLEEDKVKDPLTGKSMSLGWYVVPNIVARRKASQALREDNDPAKRKAKRARFLAKKKKATQAF